MKTLLTLTLSLSALATSAWADNTQLWRDLQRGRNASERASSTVGVMSRSHGLGDRRDMRSTTTYTTRREATDTRRMEFTQDPHGNIRVRPEVQ